jgi:hypothetical protein
VTYYSLLRHLIHGCGNQSGNAGRDDLAAKAELNLFTCRVVESDKLPEGAPIWHLRCEGRNRLVFLRYIQAEPAGVGKREWRTERGGWLRK